MQDLSSQTRNQTWALWGRSSVLTTSPPKKSLFKKKIFVFIYLAWVYFYYLVFFSLFLKCLVIFYWIQHICMKNCKGWVLSFPRGFAGSSSKQSEKVTAPHSNILAWKIPWTEEPGRLQSMGSLRVGHDWVTSLSLFTFMQWRGNWQPTPVFLPGESQGRGSLVGCRLWGRTESDRTEVT